MQYLVEKNYGVFAPGTVIGDLDIPEGRDVRDLIAMGVVSPTDGDFPVPLKDDDAKGWKARAKSLESDNKKLRTSSVDAETLVKLSDLEKENLQLTNDLAEVRSINASLSQGVVTKADYDNLNDQFEQLKTLHESTVKELEKATTPAP